MNQNWRALAAAKAAKPALTLLDIMMADIDGIDLCKFIKADPDLNEIPVIMVSALSDEGSKRDSFNADKQK